MRDTSAANGICGLTPSLDAGMVPGTTRETMSQRNATTRLYRDRKAVSRLVGNNR